MTSSQQNLDKESNSYKVKITYNVYTEKSQILDSNSIDYKYLQEKFGINLGKNKDRNPIILAVDIRSNGEILVTKNSFTTPVFIKIEDNEPWKILLVSDAFELKNTALVKIDTYELKMERILSRRSPKKVIISSDKSKNKKIFAEETKTDKQKLEKKNEILHFSSSHSQESDQSRSKNIWDFLDDILENEKKTNSIHLPIIEKNNEFDIEDPIDEFGNQSLFPKRKPLEKNQKSFEKLEEYLSSNKKLKCESPFNKTKTDDHEKSPLDHLYNSLKKKEPRMSQTPKEENSQEDSKLKRLKKFVAEKREENAKHSVTKMQSQVKNDNPEAEPCSICLSEITEFLGKLENCAHKFCFSCIKDWSDVTNECPLCKRRFEVLTKCDLTGKEIELIQVKFKRQLYEDNLQEFIDNVDDCYECGSGEDADVLLICDICGFNSCHTYCCDPPFESVPVGEWYCKFCSRGRGRRGRRNTNRNTNSNSNSNSNVIRTYQRTNTGRSTTRNANSRNRNRRNGGVHATRETQPSLLEALFEQAGDFESQYIPYLDEEEDYYPIGELNETSNRSRRTREGSNRNRGRSSRNRDEPENSLDLKIEPRTTERNNRNQTSNSVSLENLNSFRYPMRGSERYF